MTREELKKIAIEFVEANRTQTRAEYEIANAFSLLCPENMILGVSENITNAYCSLTEKVLGNEIMEWVYWWMYDCNYGQKSMTFAVGENEYDVKDMNFAHFFDLVLY